MEEKMQREFVTDVLKILENRLVRIVLYGSVARGTDIEESDIEESDIDIALIMHGRMDSDTEDKLSDLVVNMNLKYDRIFSVYGQGTD